MGKRIAKGKEGNAALFMSRGQALKKLQVSIKDFRRLCILKGIYPRDPPTKPLGSDKTYYHKKDIQFLLHEPLMQKFRDFKVFLRKRTRFIGRKEDSEVARIERMKPCLTLDHLVRERYPTFVDAIRDLDDPLTLVHLFAFLPAGSQPQHTATIPTECARLCREFQSYVVRERCLRKAFISIKGIYFQAEIEGQLVNWVVPHQFAQSQPKNVDFRVMLTFLDFYMTLLRFTNFKLFHDVGLVYPPAIDSSKDAAGQLLSAVMLRKAEANADEDDGEIDADPAVNEPFAGFVFLLSREVPAEFLEFIARSGGGRVLRADELNDDEEASVTHVVLERVRGERAETREYVQPQWLVDSFNMRKALPVHAYAPGHPLPPHLSPFVDDEQHGYVPEQKRVLQRWAGVEPEEADEQEEDEEDEEEEEEDEEEAEEEEDAPEEEEEEEVMVVTSTRKRQRSKKKVDDDEHAKGLEQIMMNNRNRRLYGRMQRGIEKKKEAIAKLHEKRRSCESQKQKKQKANN